MRDDGPAGPHAHEKDWLVLVCSSLICRPIYHWLHNSRGYCDPYYHDYHPVDGEVVYYNQWEHDTDREHVYLKQRNKAEQKEYWDWRHKNDHPLSAR